MLLFILFSLVALISFAVGRFVADREWHTVISTVRKGRDIYRPKWARGR
jgi:hypothetical protein